LFDLALQGRRGVGVGVFETICLTVSLQ